MHTTKGPSIKYVTLFLANFDPSPPVALCYTSRDPPKVRHTSRTPQFLLGLVRKSRTKVPCTNSKDLVFARNGQYIANDMFQSPLLLISPNRVGLYNSLFKKNL